MNYTETLWSLYRLFLVACIGTYAALGWHLMRRAIRAVDEGWPFRRG